MTDTKNSRFTEEQIIGFLKQAESGMPIKEFPVRRGQVLIVRYLIRDDVELEATSGEESRASLNYVIER